MHFFSPERSEASPGNKALLLDGSTLPVLTACPIDSETLRLYIMLRNYKEGSSFTYSQHHIDIRPTETSAFFISYIEDPEGTIERYFNWKPQKTTRSWNPNDFKKAPAAGKVKPEPSADDKALLDLL